MKIMINDQMLQQSTISAGVLTTKILYILSVAPNIYQKFNYTRLSYVYIFEYEHLKRFIYKKIMTFTPISGTLRIGHIFRTSG